MRAVEAFWLCGECARELTLDWTEGEMRVVRRAEVLEEVEASQKSEVRSQKSEVRSQKSEVRSQKSEVEKSEVRSQKSEVRSQKSEVRSQSPLSVCVFKGDLYVRQKDKLQIPRELRSLVMTNKNQRTNRCLRKRVPVRVRRREILRLDLSGEITCEDRDHEQDRA